jgi:hypothetical protein
VDVELHWADGQAEAALTARRPAALRCRLSGGTVRELKLPAGGLQLFRW